MSGRGAKWRIIEALLTSASEVFEKVQKEHFDALVLFYQNQHQQNATDFSSRLTSYNNVSKLCLEGKAKCQVVLSQVNNLSEATKGGEESKSPEIPIKVDEVTEMLEEMDSYFHWWSFQVKKLNYHRKQSALQKEDEGEEEEAEEISYLSQEGLLQDVNLALESSKKSRFSGDLIVFLEAEKGALIAEIEKMGGRGQEEEEEEIASIDDLIENFKNQFNQIKSLQNDQDKRLESSDYRSLRDFLKSLTSVELSRRKTLEDYLRVEKKFLDDIHSYKPSFVSNSSTVYTTDSANYLSKQSYYNNAVMFLESGLNSYSVAIQLASKAVGLDQIGGRTALAENYKIALRIGTMETFLQLIKRKTS